MEYRYLLSLSWKKAVLSLLLWLSHVNAIVRMEKGFAGLQPAVILPRRPVPAIKGGYEADPDRFKWMVSLQRYGQHFCGGVLLHEGLVVTAAHCLYEHDMRVPREEITVFLGLYQVYPSDNDQKFRIQAITVHPEFRPLNRNLDNDIAVIRLADTPTQQTRSKIDTVVLPWSHSEYQEPSNGVKVRAVGWGFLDGHNRVLPAKLRTVELATLSFGDCRERLNELHNVTETILCTDSSKGDICQGDSGGPVVVKGEKETGTRIDVLVGIISMSSYGCGMNGSASVYTRVSKFATFLQTELDRVTTESIRVSKVINISTTSEPVSTTTQRRIIRTTEAMTKPSTKQLTITTTNFHKSVTPISVRTTTTLPKTSVQLLKSTSTQAKSPTKTSSTTPKPKSTTKKLLKYITPVTTSRPLTKPTKKVSTTKSSGTTLTKPGILRVGSGLSLSTRKISVISTNPLSERSRAPTAGTSCAALAAQPGHSTSRKNRSSLVSIRLNNGHICSGTLIASNMVVTAATCLHYSNWKVIERQALTVVIGFNAIGNYSSKQEMAVHSTKIHGQFVAKEQKFRDHNIAVVRLQMSIDKLPKFIRDTVSVASLPQNGDKGYLRKDYRLMSVGWPSASAQGPTHRQWKNVTPLPAAVCEEKWTSRPYVANPRLLCTDSPLPACLDRTTDIPFRRARVPLPQFADTGSPLMALCMTDQGMILSETLIGVANMKTSGCTSTQKRTTDFYIRTSAVMTFLNQQMLAAAIL